MSVAFWSSEISSKKPYNVQPPEGYVLNLQQVTLVTDDPKACARVYAQTLSVETGDEIKACICVLRGVTAENCSVSIVFGYDCPVTFHVEGSGKVHLNGYLQPGPELDGDDDSMGEMDDEELDSDEMDSDEDDSGDEEDEQIDSANPPVATKKAVSALVAAKQAAEKELSKQGSSSSDSEESSGDEEDDSKQSSSGDEEDDSEDEEFIRKMIEKTMGSAAKPFKAGPKESAPVEIESGSSSSSEEDSEDDSDSDSESDEEPPMKAQKTTPKGKVMGQQQSKSQNNTPANKGQQQMQSKSQKNTPANKGQQQMQSKSQNNTPGNKQQNKGGKSQNNTPKPGDKRKH